MPERIQRRRTKGWKMPENTVYVGRGTMWGNPYRVGVHGDAAECVRLFRQVSWLPAAAWSLKGKDLACWCALPKPGEPDLCHAAVLLDISNRVEYQGDRNA